MRFKLLIVFLGLSFSSFGQGFVTNKQLIWRSALLPGWGQFYNQNVAAGLLFSGGVAAGIGAYLYAESQRQDQILKSNQTSNLSLKRTFNERANDWSTTRNLIGIAAAVVYLGNLIHASAVSSNVYAYRGRERRLQFFVGSGAGGEAIGLRLRLGQKSARLAKPSAAAPFVKF